MKGVIPPRMKGKTVIFDTIKLKAIVEGGIMQGTFVRVWIWTHA